MTDNKRIITISDFVAVLYDQRDELKAGLGSHSALFQFIKPLYTKERALIISPKTTKEKTLTE